MRPRRRGEDLARRILGGYRKAKVGADNATYLLQAAAGSNRVAVEASSRSTTSSASRPTGCSCSTQRASRTRYWSATCAQGVRQEARRFGAQRQANHLAAVQAGLTNLAQRAGYADAVRLEWAMEARIGEDVAPWGGLDSGRL